MSAPASRNRPTATKVRMCLIACYALQTVAQRLLGRVRFCCMAYAQNVRALADAAVRAAASEMRLTALYIFDAFCTETPNASLCRIHGSLKSLAVRSRPPVSRPATS